MTLFIVKCRFDKAKNKQCFTVLFRNRHVDGNWK